MWMVIIVPQTVFIVLMGLVEISGFDPEFARVWWFGSQRQPI
jgi:hypothetical protein